MAFESITDDIIKQALQSIDEEEIPKQNQSKVNILVVDGKEYPPKYVLATALRIAKVDANNFNSNTAVSFFEGKNGYEIKRKTLKQAVLGNYKWDAQGYHCIDLNTSGNEFILTKEFGDSYQSNGFIVEQKGQNKQTQCRLKWWAGTSNNKKRFGDDLIKKTYESAVKILIEVCEKKWPGKCTKVPEKENDQTGMTIDIAILSKGMEDEFINEIYNWKENNYDDFDKIQGRILDEIKKGISVETIKKELLDEVEMEKYTSLLLKNHNIILHGAPGTGKTYLARKIAKELIFSTEAGFSAEEKALIEKKESEVEETEKGKFTTLKQQFNQQCGFVQFHQSYDYTDFVEGLRPQNQGAEIGFVLKNGVFKDFCEKALKDGKEKKFIFIIDEINRGEMSKIFGELFYSIDPGYRVEYNELEEGKIPTSIQTQYSNLQEKPNPFDEKLGIVETEENKGRYGHFFVPENVYIIGTMNDIDRSVESMDFAMRRRFAFEEITAKKRAEMLNDLPNEEWINAANEKMEALNAAIESIDGLSAAYHIGPAYFLKIKNYDGKFDLLWEYHIEGVVREYLRGMDNINENMRNLAKAYGYTSWEIKYKDKQAGNK